MKLSKVFSTILAVIMFKTDVAADGFNCNGVIFTAAYIRQVLYVAFHTELNSISGWPKLFVPSTPASGHDGYREYPLLSSLEIWNGGGFSYRALLSPAGDTVNVYSDLDGGYECVSA
ncbi:unnamed protein product [Blumeria hordei]|uniref:Uncharacterized protein n=1 Tax=Blumeria hordei TaxID=2867405 RepID=A0A383UJV2_BLUHO|nr:unnamed protein product [Blumeria hordei]